MTISRLLPISSAPESISFHADSNESFTLVFNEQSYAIYSVIRTQQEELGLTVEVISQTAQYLDLAWYYQANLVLSQRWQFEQVEGEVRGRFSNTLTGHLPFDGILVQKMGFVTESEPYFMIPGSLYGTNNLRNAKSIQPQLNYRGDVCYPKTPTIFTRADRSTHNAVIAVNDSNVVALRIDESCTMSDGNIQYNGLGVDTRADSAQDFIAVTMGYHHYPVQYRGKLYEESRSASDVKVPLSLSESETWQCSGHIFLAQSQNRFSYQKAITYFYQQIHTPPNNQEPRDKVIKDLTLALLDNCYNWENHYFPTVLSGQAADTGTSGDMAWTGGMQVAYPLAVASQHHPEARTLVCDFINHLVNEGINSQANLFFEGKDGDQWKVCGWWQNDIEVYDDALNRLPEAHSAYVNGQACCYIFKTVALARQEQWDEPNIDLWFSSAQQIIDKVIASQRFDGAYGVYFNPADGKPVYFNSFQGAWFMAAVAELALMTKEQKYIDSFNQANQFYWQFHEQVELWGTPIDTRDAVDEEGNLAYITALTSMHKLTGEDALITQLVHALHYDFSWKFAYNTGFVNEPLKSLNWPSCGGCITSTHNIHIHQMGNLIAAEMYYVYQQTKDEYIKSRLQDTLNWGLGTHNPTDNYFGFGQTGWATEQFFHSDGRQDDPARIEDGGIWYDYLSWAAACTLLSTAVDIPDEYY